MTLDGNILEIDLDMDLEEVIVLKEFVGNRIEYIDSIEATGSKEKFVSSSLFSLLFSIKKSKPQIKIPIIDVPLELSEYGVVNWKLP